jgi:hypothetical protein
LTNDNRLDEVKTVEVERHGANTHCPADDRNQQR